MPELKYFFEKTVLPHLSLLSPWTAVVTMLRLPSTVGSTKTLPQPPEEGGQFSFRDSPPWKVMQFLLLVSSCGETALAVTPLARGNLFFVSEFLQSLLSRCLPYGHQHGSSHRHRRLMVFASTGILPFLRRSIALVLPNFPCQLPGANRVVPRRCL